MEENFKVMYPSTSEVGNEQSGKEQQSFWHSELAAAGETYDPSNREYAVYLATNEGQVSLTQSRIEELSASPQSNLAKTQEIIQINRQYANKNDLIGLTLDCVENNVNVEYRMTWADCRKKDRQKAIGDEARAIIADFNEKINIDQIIRDAITNVYRDGTYVLYLRKKLEKTNSSSSDYTIDQYPLGVVEISDYNIGGEPCVLMNIDELKSRLTKTYKKTKKNQPLFFKAMEDEVKKNYPIEVVRGFQNKEKYVRLDMGSSGVMRLNTQGKQYGLSPIFRALSPTLMIEKLEAADRAVARNRAKTIVAQYLYKETGGQDFKQDTYPFQASAHKNLMSAWQQSVVVMTAPGVVRDIRYIEPKGDLTNILSLNYYRTKVMSTLGITFFADKGQSLGTTNLGTKQLMRTINKISKQVESILHKWYKMVLQAHGIDPIYAPSIQILDSEMLDTSTKMELARTLFTTFNGSYQTAFDTLGLSLEDEIERRQAENDEGLDEVFVPRDTTYNKSAESSPSSTINNKRSMTKPGEKTPGAKGGRTPDKNSKNEEKQEYDRERYQAINQ